MAPIDHSKHEKPTQVWKSLEDVCLPARSYDIEFWWQVTGYHLAKMVEAAGYPIERQYEVLLFHYHWIVPRLGPAPGADGLPKWKALMAHDGSPLEYSWKWNTTNSLPEVRYSWEPYNPGADSTANPRNHEVSLDYMKHISKVVPQADFTWARHFLSEIETGDRPTSNFLHAVEFHRKKPFDLKSYFLPRATKLLEGGDSGVMKEWDDAVVKLDPKNPTREVLRKFLKTNPEGQALSPVVLAMDDVSPSKSRLKMYFLTSHTSFKALRQIMTLGGLVDIPEESLQEIRSLITTILGLPEDFPEDANTPVQPPIGKSWVETENLFECFVYFFDIAPQNGVPDVKFYLPTRRYGPDDLAIAHRTIEWMKARGRGAYADQYLQMMEAVAEHRGLENGKGLHSFISYQVNRNGEPDIKTYFTSETYHPTRFTGRDNTTNGTNGTNATNGTNGHAL
ncbi:aromatic prenyltransferase [Durotheca rogersii]|uniref:aromatic prenyltransferase n=1 Tax=Durotheca rogersii TaxID=419775 RepID=UPI00221E6938|nr:aromatic prenyltransferase [Durotheca rogersii]KAI5868213.1 aromatic prenyltransferase [Durotheca rogersii]